MRRNQRKSLSPLLVGSVVLVLAAIIVYLGFTKSIPFKHHYTIQAVFPTANNVKKASPVRIAGVNIGKVSSVTRLQEGHPGAVVSMEINKTGLPIHKDATFKIRPRIFLEGNFFVDVSPGSPSSPTLGDGDRVPMGQASAPVQLDQVLGALQAPTRQDLRSLLKELDAGLSGGGAQGYNRSSKYWKAAYRDSAIVNDALQGTQPHDLSGYIKSAGTAGAAIDQNREQLKSLVTDFNRTAAAFAARDRDLSATIFELPRTLRAGMPALRELNAAFPAVRQFVRAARPAVRASGPAIDASMPFLRQARGLVSKPELLGLTSDLRSAVPNLAKLTTESVPLYSQVSQASECQNDTILPWSHDQIQDPQFPTRGPVYQESTKSLVGLAGESRTGDANGQWFRVLLNQPAFAYPDAQGSFFVGDQIQGVNPPVAGNRPRPPLRSDVPCETQQSPDLRTQAGPAPSGGFKLADPPQAAKVKALADVVDQLRSQLSDKGSPLKVSDVPATLSELGK
jgi:phospholipid/cholesterol/gamma-HCH transport system substrate-binding protein